MTASENTCLLCHSPEILNFLYRPRVPVHQNYLIESASEAEALQSGDLDMRLCKSCGFVYNQAFDSEMIAYGESYENNQTISGSFSHYIDSLIEKIINEGKVENSSIIELGCGNGEFLRRLIEKGKGNKGLGFDPAYRGAPTELDGQITYYSEYYGEDSVDIPADIILCRHVIEHVQNPLSFLKSVRKGLAKSPNARLFFETPCVEWILKNKVTWDFFYEHCSLFTKSSLKTVFELADFEVVSVEHTFGGQYLWLEAKVGRQAEVIDIESQSQLIDWAQAFSEEEQHLNAKWDKSIQVLKNEGLVALWGAGAKGVTFANMVDAQRDLLTAVIDINPNKQGMFLPGTGHPIVAPEAIAKNNIKSVVVLNPNYCDEIASLLSNLKLDVRVVDLSHEC